MCRRRMLILQANRGDEMRRLYINTKKKQADCLSDSRRRMLILQANRGGEMRRLFFVLLTRLCGLIPALLFFLHARHQASKMCFFRCGATLQDVPALTCAAGG